MIGLMVARQVEENEPEATQVQQLFPAQIVAHEVDIPTEDAVIGGALIVRIPIGFRCLMMTSVVPVAEPVGQARVQKQADPADQAVQPRLFWNEAVVHGVVGHDEQSRVQKRPDQDNRAEQQRWDLIQRQVQAEGQRQQPG